MKKTTFLLALLCLFANCHAQILSSSENFSVTEIEVCQTQAFSIEIAHTSGAFSPLDTVSVGLDLPPGLTFASGSVTIGTLSVDSSDLRHPVFTLTALSGNSFHLNYTVQVDCQRFSPVTTIALSNAMAVSYNGQADHNFSSTTYNIVSPWFVFDAPSSRNLNFTTAQFSVPIERDYKFVNTSFTPFNGQFLFTDTLELDSASAGLRLDSIELLYPASGVVDVAKIVTDTAIFYTVSVSNLGQNDSLVFREYASLIRCPSGSLDNSVTRFRADYGCATGDLCQGVANPIYFTHASFDPNDRPIILLELLTPGYPACWSDPQERLLKVTNVGAGVASDVKLRFVQYNNLNSITGIDTNSIEFFKKQGNVEVALPFLTIENFGFYQVYDSAYISQSVLETGDSLFIRYYEVVNCIDSLQFDNYYNNKIQMHHETPLIIFEHPCHPNFRYLPYIPFRSWEHDFSFNQYFENLISAMSDGQERWFEIDNETNLVLGRETYQFFFDLDSCRIKVELKLDSGLALVPNSLSLFSPQGTGSTSLFPAQVDYALGNGTDSATGDMAIAYFDFPQSFHLNYPAITASGFIQYASPEFKKFFNRFKVKFKLKSYCDKVASDGKANIKENFLFIPNTNCVESCALPLAQVSDEISIYCPNTCSFPSWHTNSVFLGRENLGFADANNNNHPDTFPFENTFPYGTADTQHVMIGDTFHLGMWPFLNNGNPTTFNNVGFSFDEAQLHLTGSILHHLRFIGASGLYWSQQGYGYLTVPDTAGHFSANGFTVDLGIDALQSYGVPPITNFARSGTSLQLYPTFVVVDNLINGSGPDPYYSIETIKTTLNMSGTPYSETQIKTDASTISLADFANLDSTSRSELNYKCGEAEVRLVGIGTNFWYQQEAISYWERNPCYKTFSVKGYSDVGMNFAGGYLGEAGSQKAWNSFSYELRNLWKLDSATINFPGYLEVEKVVFRTTQLIYDTLNNLTRYTPFFFTQYDLSDAILGDSSLTIYPARNYDSLTDPGIYQPRFTGYDETKRHRMFIVLIMKDCQNTPSLISLGTSYPLSTFWSNFPGAQNGDTTIVVDQFYSTNSFEMPSAILNTQVLPFLQNSGNSDLSWQINIQTAENYLYQNGFVRDRAENSFLYVVSPSGNIQVDDILQNGDTIPRVDSIDGIPLFGLDVIGSNWSQYIRANLTVNASYACENVDSLDSLLIITGWNCYGYPATIEEACYQDTTIMYIQPENPGLQGILSVSDTIDACDSILYNLELKATGLGKVENTRVRLNLPNGGELTYLPGSGMLAYMGDSVLLDPILDSAGLYWDLDSVSFFVHQFEGLNPEAHLTFAVQSGCGYNTEAVELVVSATNYCGKLIGPFNLERQPETILGLPQLDSLEISSFSTPYPLCEQSSLTTFSIENVGAMPTGPSGQLQLILSMGINYYGGTPAATISGDTLIWNLSAGQLSNTLENIQVNLGSNLPVGNYPIPYFLSTTAAYLCDSSLCLLEEDLSTGFLNFTIEDCVTDYCEAGGLNSTYEWIDRVAVGSINNVSGDNGGYADFSSLNTNLTAGAIANVTLEPGFLTNSYQESWRIWVDWNRDGDFDDSGEFVWQGNGNTALTAGFLVPQNAASGSLKMRVAMKWNSWPSGPCCHMPYGEVEDYSITVVPPASIVPVGRDEPLRAGASLAGGSSKTSSLELEPGFNSELEFRIIYPNPALRALTKQVSLEFRAGKEIELQIAVQGLMGQEFSSRDFVAKEGENLVVIDISELASGTYLLEIRSENGISHQKLVVE